MNESDSPEELGRPETDDQDERRVRRALNARLGGYLTRKLLRQMPAGIDSDSVRLIERFFAHSAQESPAQRASEAFLIALDTSQIGMELKVRWSSAGGELSQLRKLIAMVGYRTDVLRSEGHKRPATSPADLERFWSAGGHDLTELAGFLKETDREGMDYLPK